MHPRTLIVFAESSVFHLQAVSSPLEPLSVAGAAVSESVFSVAAGSGTGFSATAEPVAASARMDSVFSVTVVSGTGFSAVAESEEAAAGLESVALALFPPVFPFVTGTEVLLLLGVPSSPVVTEPEVFLLLEVS